MIYVIVFLSGVAIGAAIAHTWRAYARTHYVTHDLPPQMDEEEQRVLQDRLAQWDELMHYNGPKRG